MNPEIQQLREALYAHEKGCLKRASEVDSRLTRIETKMGHLEKWCWLIAPAIVLGLLKQYGVL